MEEQKLIEKVVQQGDKKIAYNVAIAVIRGEWRFLTKYKNRSESATPPSTADRS